jgi:hypothetical protein
MCRPGEIASLVTRAKALQDAQISRTLAELSRVLRDAPLWGAPQDEVNLCVAERFDLILRSERSERLEGPPQPVRDVFTQYNWIPAFAGMTIGAAIPLEWVPL